jgi:hypothetical protein
MSDESAREEYVRRTIAALGWTLTPEQTTRVAAAWARNVEVAALVTDFDLPDDIEPAAIFRP